MRGRKAAHWHLVEFGHKGGTRTTRSGRKVFVNSSARARPYIRPALRSTEQQQLRAAQKAMEKSLARLALNLRNNRLTTRQRGALLA